MVIKPEVKEHYSKSIVLVYIFCLKRTIYLGFLNAINILPQIPS